MKTERFVTFNQELRRILEEDFPKSLLDGIIICAKNFNIEIDEAVKLLGDDIKEELSKEYNINLSEGFADGLF